MKQKLEVVCEVVKISELHYSSFFSTVYMLKFFQILSSTIIVKQFMNYITLNYFLYDLKNLNFFIYEKIL